MHWSKADVIGEFPIDGIRSHTTTPVKNKLIIIGGCDSSDNFNDVMVFDTGMRFILKHALLSLSNVSAGRLVLIFCC